MPLPGGASDKLGNRYELRVIARRELDLLTGRLQWLRVEPPGEHAIEFRCMTSDGYEEAHQVKRGLSGGGHWTISALADVLDGFGKLLAAERNLRCVFCSEHAASDLKELSERAQQARDLGEFTTRFLDAKWVANAWQQLRTHWNTNESETWERLRRVRVETVGEQHLKTDTDAIVQLLLDGQPETVRAVLTEFALEAVHRELRRDEVLERLTERGIRTLKSGDTLTIATSTSPPPSGGVRRQRELQKIADDLAHGKTTIFIGGIAGIGKTTVAAQAAAEWAGPVCWIDCGLVTSAAEAVSTLADFVATALHNDDVRLALKSPNAQAATVARLAGKHLAARGSMIVWDGVDGEVAERLRPAIDSIAGTIAGGAQLITAQAYHQSGGAATTDLVHVRRFEKEVVRRLLVEAYPEARVPDLEAADEFTQGHPYLVQLLTGTRTILDLKTALQTLASGGNSELFVSHLLTGLGSSSQSLLKILAWLGVPFRAANIERLGGTPEIFRELAERYFVIRAGSDWYRVHEIIANLIGKSVSEVEAGELHQRAALFLAGLEHASWAELRAALRHARAVSMDQVGRRAAAALLKYATDNGQATLAREAAESLTKDAVSTKWFYPHFILGKCARMTQDPEAALVHYADAEASAEGEREREIVRYERASVLCELGRAEEGDALFAELGASEDLGRRAASKTALALGIGRRGDLAGARAMLKEAADIAKQAGLPREEADAWQSEAMVLAQAGQWKEAREAARRAHALRLSHSDSYFDIYGWYHLMEVAFAIETALNNDEAARQAAHGMWRYAVMSGSLRWEAFSAEMMCLSDPDETDSEIVEAVRRLRIVGGDLKGSAESRSLALSALAVCEWRLHHYEAAVEALAEMTAIVTENRLPPRLFVFLPQSSKRDENVVRLERGAYGLLVPPGQGEDFVVGTASRVFDRRPELAQYAALLKTGRPPARRKRRSNRKRNRRKRR